MYKYHFLKLNTEKVVA